MLRHAEHEGSELRLAARGSELAFLGLVDRYHPTLVRVASLWVEEQVEIEALVKQTWSAMLRRLERFDDQSSLKGWLCVTLIKLARQRSGPEADERLQLEAAAPRLPAVDPARFSPANNRWQGHWQTPPQDWPAQVEVPHQILAAAIARLPHAERLLVVLRDSESLSSVEVERALDFAEPTQQRLLHSGRSQVRAALEQYYYTLAPSKSEAT